MHVEMIRKTGRKHNLDMNEIEYDLRDIAAGDVDTGPVLLSRTVPTKYT